MCRDCGNKTKVSYKAKSLGVESKTMNSQQKTVSAAIAVPTGFKTKDQHRRYLFTLRRDNPTLYKKIISG